MQGASASTVSSDDCDPIGTVFNIQRFSIDDGPGIRTTVFLKGCPLACIWCHNPESRDHRVEMLFSSDRCTGCAACIRACPHQCHRIVDGQHEFRRDHCIRCGLCAQHCLPQALEQAGRSMTVAEVLAIVTRDHAFYRTSGGGMTLSGGEPMAQPLFTSALLRAAKANGLHTAIETCGQASPAAYAAILDDTDLFLYDCKETDPERHRRFTGVGNGLILENQRTIDRHGRPCILRCPIVPGLNDRPDHFAGIARLANSLAHIIGIDLLPYHPLGATKSVRLGKEYALAGQPFAEPDAMRGWIEQLEGLTDVPVQTGR